MTYKCYVKYNKKNEKHYHVVLVIPQMVYMHDPSLKELTRMLISLTICLK